jgi:hypothetical protein
MLNWLTACRFLNKPGAKLLSRTKDTRRNRILAAGSRSHKRKIFAYTVGAASSREEKNASKVNQFLSGA